MEIPHQSTTTEVRPEEISPILRLLQVRPAFRNVALGLCILSILLSLALWWFAWVKGLPYLWSWGFNPLSIKALPAAIVLILLAFLTILTITWVFQVTAKVLSVYVDVQTTRMTEAVDRGSTELGAVEEELKGVDKSGLIHLLRYSRLQLEAYYRISLTQTQQSFRYSAIAMWIGFAVILAGIIVRVVDLRKLGLLPPDKVTALAIIAGVVIEVVSALFLWIYRYSVKQLTYFYDRQMYNHSVLMCYRIAESMTAGAAEDLKKAISERVLDKAWVLEQEAPPRGISLVSFGAKKSATYH